MSLRTRLTALLLLALASSQASAAHRVIVFVWDGMRPDAISDEDTPNLAALVKEGTFFADNHATYPTFTMVNASSFATGSFPGTIGFFGNRFWAPGASGFDAKGAPSDFAAPVYTEDYAVLRALDDHYHHDLLQAPTLLERARKKGLKTAVVGKSGPAFLQDIHEGGVILDETWRCRSRLRRRSRRPASSFPPTSCMPTTMSSSISSPITARRPRSCRW